MPILFLTRRIGESPLGPAYLLAHAMGASPGTNNIGTLVFYSADDMPLRLTESLGSANLTQCIEWDNDDTYLVSGHTLNNRLRFYKRSVDDSTLSLVSSGPPTLATTKISARWSRTNLVNGRPILAMICETAPNIETLQYDGTGDNFSVHVANIDTQPGTNTFDVEWTLDDSVLIASTGDLGSGHCAAVYTRSGTSFTRVLPAPFDTAIGSGVGSPECRGFSLNPVYPVAVFQVRNSGTGAGTYPAYTYSGSSFTRITADAGSGGGGGTIGLWNGNKRMAWTADGRFLYVGNNTIGTQAKLRCFEYNPNTVSFSIVDVSAAAATIADGSTLTVSADGLFLAIDGTGSGGKIFEINPSTGALTLAATYSIQGSGGDTFTGTQNVTGYAFGKTSAQERIKKMTSFFTQQRMQNAPKGYYEFEETVNTTLLDTLASGNNFTIVFGSPTVQQDGPRPNNKSMLFDGVDDGYDRTSAIMSQVAAQTGTVHIVTKPLSLATETVMYGQGSTSNANQFAYMYISTTGELGFMSQTSVGNSSRVETVGAGISVDQWYHLAVKLNTVGAGSVRFFINGVEYTTTSATLLGTGQAYDFFNATAGLLDRSCVAKIRKGGAHSQFYNGYIDELWLHNTGGISNSGQISDAHIALAAKYSLNRPD